MQPQDNDFPIDQVQGGVVPTSAGDQGLPQQPLVGGSTFQPQDVGAAGAQPGWMNDAQNDASQLNAAAAQPEPIQPQEPVQPTTQESNPLLVQEQAQPMQPQEPAPMPVQPLMDQPPVQDSQLPGQPGPQMAAKEPPQYEQPVATAAATQAMPMQTTDPYAQPQNQSALPGSDTLGQAVAGMDTQQAQQAVPEGNYGPPPKKRGAAKVIFIVLGIIIGLAAIGGGVFYFLGKRTTNTSAPTTQDQIQTATPTPSSGPATPPAGYETITKQCYTFALKVPNTVPKDMACSFDGSNYGSYPSNQIQVTTSTQPYKTIEEVMQVFKPTVTVVSENNIKLDNVDAVQLIYKASDGITYSNVFLLIVGRNYQQDGQAVTSFIIKTGYQEQYDKEVTKNVLDTWRWQ